MSTVICSYCLKERRLEDIRFDEVGLPVCIFCSEGKRAVESNFNNVIGNDKSFLDKEQNTLRKWFK